MEEMKSVSVFGVDITDQDAIAFLQSFGGKKACDVCLKNEWMVNFVAPTDGDVLAFRTSKPDGSVGGDQMPIFNCYCTTCGFMRIHSAYQLAEWVRSRGGTP